MTDIYTPTRPRSSGIGSVFTLGGATTAPDTSKRPSNAHLIQLAYSLSLGPERYEELFEALDVHLADDVNAFVAGTLSPSASQEVVQLESHFVGALDLLRAQGRRKHSATSAVRTLDASARPALTVSPHGVVLHANPGAASVLGLAKGDRIDADALAHRLSRTDLQTLMRALRGLDASADNAILCIVGITDSRSDQTVQLALSRAPDWRGNPIGLLSALHISWFPETGRRFRAMMGLTATELEITRAIVTGVSLTDLAAQRGRKVTTVRNQCKALLRKLDVRSQTELACLYSGFSQFSSEMPDLRDAEARDPAVPEILPMPAREGGSPGVHCIDYVMAGPVRGRPAVLIPSMLGGRAVTSDLRRALHAHNIRLVMPWREGFARTYRPDGFASGDPWQATAREVEALLDHLRIPNAPVIGMMTSTQYAYACAYHIPDRVTRVLGLAPGLPTVRGDYLRHLGRGQKLRSFLARETPRMGRLIAHGFLSRVDAGYDVEFIRHYLQSSPADLAFTERADTVATFRHAYEETHAQGYDGFINEIEYFARDWHVFPDALTRPVHLIVGEQESAFPPRAVHAFAHAHPGTTAITVPDAGHLVGYESPDSWLPLLYPDPLLDPDAV